MAASGEQHGKINGRRHAAHAIDVAQSFGKRAIVRDAFGAGARQIDVRGYAKETVLNRPAKSSIHGQRNHERRHASGDSDHGKHCHQAQYGRLVGRPKVPARDQPGKPPFWPPQPLLADIPVGCSADFEAPSVESSPEVSGRSSGNKITSRIECESVNSMVSRSMPMPSPAVGGIPWASARM